MNGQRIPDTWTVARLSDLALINPPVNQPRVSDDLPVSFVPMAAVQEETGHLDASTSRRFGDLRRKSYRYFEEGDVIFAKITPCMENGKVALARGLHGGRAFGSTEFHVFRPLEGVDGLYILYYMLQKSFRDEARHHMTGTAGQLRVPAKFLEGVEIPLPPTSEQRRIVTAIEELLSRIHAGVEALQRARRNLQRMRAAVLQAAVTGQLVSQDSEDEPAETMLKRAGIDLVRDANFPSLPGGWVWVRFGDLLRLLRNGIFVSRPTDDPVGIPILRISAVRPMQLDLEDVRYLPNRIGQKELQPFFLATEDLLFTRYSGNSEFVGACAMVRRLPKPTLHPDKLIRAVVNKEIAAPRFLELATSAGYSRDYIRRRRRTTAGQTGISGGDLKGMPVPLPPLAEQVRIAQEVERQFSVIQALARAVEGSFERIALLRRRILRAAFQGGLVPQDASDEPASILMDRIRVTRAAEETKVRLHGRMRR